MLPLFLKDGLLVPYVVTSLAFLFFSIYLLSALEHCSEDKLRLGPYRRLLICMPRMDLGRVTKWKVSVAWWCKQIPFHIALPHMPVIIYSSQEMYQIAKQTLYLDSTSVDALQTNQLHFN
jgi:hypothetical protein